MRLLLFLFSAALLLAGCEKYTGPTTATGQVVEAHTRQPVPAG